MDHRNGFTVQIVFGLLIAVISCSPRQTATHQPRNELQLCEPPNYIFDVSLNPVKDLEKIIDEELLSRYSRHVLLVANASGILGELKELTALKRKAALAKESREQFVYLAKRQELLTRLILVSTEIASVSAELDCEGERADEVSGFLETQETRRVKNLTILSITIGAVTGIATSILSSRDSESSEIIAITGGAIGAALGVRALFLNKRVVFNHSRNLLAEVWNEPEKSAIYPASVWYYLTDKGFGHNQYSLCRNMHERWEQYGLIGEKVKEKARLETLFFGTGGLYNAEELRNRADMLNQLQAIVRLMNQDLQTLILELSK
jgi:hypothetical protein